MERILIESGDEVACEIILSRGAARSAEVVMPPQPGRDRVALFAQPGSMQVAENLHDSFTAAGRHSELKLLPDREAAKTLAVAEECYLWLNSLGMTRSDAIVAVGGGAATDLGGFIGATYLRGIETVLVPTTLLGAVDAAIGGKSAVNVGGKNLAGVFSHPARVIVDGDVLADLPEELLIEGTAEAVKAGFIADPGLLDLYASHGLAAPIDEVLSRAIRVKADVVSSDFTETGQRIVLNYGHTIGHAIEHVAGIPHGHAVAIGMVAAGAVSESLVGFADAVAQRNLLASLRLPTVAPPDLELDAIEATLRLDKKRDTSGVRMVLLEEFGKPVVETVDTTTVRAALSAVGIA
ncbi:MAG: 3-dehydroquinate synthase [bacterium]|nr:3-dehydroquinate synthase [bacterium]